MCSHEALVLARSRVPLSWTKGTVHTIDESVANLSSRTCRQVLCKLSMQQLTAAAVQA